MKKDKLFIILLLFPIIGFSQNKDITIYRNVYNHLIKNELRNYNGIGISPEIVFIEYSSFVDKKTSMNKLDSLNELDNKIRFNSYYMKGLYKKIKAKKSTNNIIYFSKPYEGFLIADFISSKKQITGNYKTVTMFSNIRRYLFKINHDKVLKIVDVEISNN